MRVAPPPRGGGAAAESIETPEGTQRDEALAACSRGKVAAVKPMGGGAWKQEPRPGELKTLERQKAHESIEAALRVTPPHGQRTPARCQALEPSPPAGAIDEAIVVRPAATRAAKLSTTDVTKLEEAGRSTAGGLRASRGATASFRGKSSGGRNPMSVAGMKQGRQGLGGRKPSGG
jgi:hypothetical protein